MVIFMLQSTLLLSIISKCAMFYGAAIFFER
jgi:hypothetical protein